MSSRTRSSPIPLAQAAAAAKGVSTRLIVVAVDIREDPVRQAFKKLAEDTGGVLVIVEAANPGALRLALQRSVLRIGYEVLDATGLRVAEGDLNGEGPALPLGTYEVRLQTVPPVTVRGVRRASGPDRGPVPPERAEHDRRHPWADPSTGRELKQPPTYTRSPPKVCQQSLKEEMRDYTKGLEINPKAYRRQ